MQIHHIGYLVKNLEKSLAQFKALGFEVERETKYDSLRQINICFVTNEGYRVELVEPATTDSPMDPLLKRYKNAPYHICYITDDLGSEMTKLMDMGYSVINEPLEAPCIDGRKVAFLLNSSVGMIELVEA